MHITCLTKYGEGIGIAHRLAEHDAVDVFVQQGKYFPGELATPIESWRPNLNKTSFILCLSNRFAQYEKIFKEHHKIYLGTSVLGSMLAKRKFTDFVDRYAIPSELPSPGITCRVVCGFFNGVDWISPFVLCENFSYLFAGDIGPTVISMGTIAKAIKKQPNYAEEFAKGLRQLNLRDLVTIIYNEDFSKVIGIATGLQSVLEVFGEGIKEDLGYFLYKVATGTTDKAEFTEDWLISVNITIPPFPYAANIEVPIGKGIDGINPENLRHLYLKDIQKIDNKYSVAGTLTQEVFSATARGRTLKEARKRVYRTIKNISLTNMQYRNDIGLSCSFEDIVDEL